MIDTDDSPNCGRAHLRYLPDLYLLQRRARIVSNAFAPHRYFNTIFLLTIVSLSKDHGHPGSRLGNRESWKRLW
jgi:hypothetical protein